MRTFLKTGSISKIELESDERSFVIGHLNERELAVQPASSWMKTVKWLFIYKPLVARCSNAGGAHTEQLETDVAF